MPVRAVLAGLWEQSGHGDPEAMLDWPSDLLFQFLWYNSHRNVLNTPQAEEEDDDA